MLVCICEFVHLYTYVLAPISMDYMAFVEHHRIKAADITVACIPMDQTRASDFGLMRW
jgi:ADP-glucose pyrophosphorylase